MALIKLTDISVDKSEEAALKDGYLYKDLFLDLQPEIYYNKQLNKTVTLKGCNLGNWLMLEMWMLNYTDRGFPDQYDLIKTLETRFDSIMMERQSLGHLID